MASQTRLRLNYWKSIAYWCSCSKICYYRGDWLFRTSDWSKNIIF